MGKYLARLAGNQIPAGSGGIVVEAWGSRETIEVDIIAKILLFFNLIYKESEKIFYYYPQDEKIEKQTRLAGFCAGIVKFTE